MNIERGSYGCEGLAHEGMVSEGVNDGHMWRRV